MACWVGGVVDVVLLLGVLIFVLNCVGEVGIIVECL